MQHKNNLSWKIGGEAGFGIKSAGIMFARIFQKCGYEIFDYSEYPSLIRGGHNTYQLIVDIRPVNSVTRSIDVLVALNQETIDQHIEEVTDGGVIIFDSEKAKFNKARAEKHRVEAIGLPLTTLAKQAGNELMRNVAVIGSTLALVDQNLTVANRVVSEQFARKGEEIVKKNIAALKMGFDYVKAHYKKDFICTLPTRKNIQNNILITASESLALGAIANGLNFYAGYPMTPSSPILHYVAEVADKTGIALKHAEDEISVINMALGAAHVGARAMTATSGGGFSLMVESLGLASITETPLVIVDAMRPGPATGLPTWTEQGDLQFVLRAAQGDFPRIVMAPGDVKEAFDMGAESLNLAEIYQMPVIILTDKYLAEGNSTSPRFTTDGIQVKRGKLLTQDQLNKISKYDRYKVTNDGISPRALPGMKGGIYIANSDEHDGYGYSEESSANRIAQVDKRQRKLDSFARVCPEPLIYGNARAKNTVVFWGSTKGPILDAYAHLPEKIQKKIRILQIQYLWPFPGSIIKNILHTSKKVLLIENNSNAQLGQLIAQETGYLIHHKLLKYDGRPFWREEIDEALRKL